MVKNHTDKELKELLQLQKKHIMKLLKYFDKDITEEDMNKVIGIVSKVNTYKELHLENVRRHLEKSLTPELREKLDDYS